MGSKKIGWLMIFCLAIFLIGAIRLFMLTFERGDVYPAYSSLRSDPLGVRVLYESLNDLPRVEVDRNYRSMSRAPMTLRTTLFYMGSSPRSHPVFNDDFNKFLDRFSTLGGRLVLAFAPGSIFRGAPGADAIDSGKSPGKTSPEDEQRDPDRRDEKEDGQAPSRGSPDDPMETESEGPAGEEPIQGAETESGSVRPSTRLKVDIDFSEADDSDEIAVRRNSPGSESLPREIAWRSTMYFKSPGEAWQTIYSRDEHPVIIERQWGLGSIVLSADAYLFSNEAMRKNRHPELLAWFTGPSTRVIFEESHFGIAKSRGIATLARKYRLHGLFFALVVLALLFVWKNAVSLVPSSGASPESGKSPPSSARDGAEGLVNLMRGNIPGKELLDVCFTAWEKSAAKDKRVSDDQKEKVKALIEMERSKPKKECDPVKTYRQIHHLLKNHEKK